MSGETSKLLHEILICEHRGASEKVAEVAGLSRSSVFEQCYGNVNVSVRVLKAAYLVTLDPRLKKLLEPEGWELVRKLEGIKPARGAESETTDVLIAAGKVIEELRRAKSDGILDAKEQLNLYQLIELMKREVAEAEAAMAAEIKQHG